MKAPKKGKEKKKVNKKGSISKHKPHIIRKEQVLVVAHEIKYARLLSGNEKKTRDRVLKVLKKWLTNCFEKGYEFKEDDFARVWKGLFYAVWMSDKPLIQEELCESIAGILDLFPAEQLRHALLMVKAGFKVLATEWYGIDQHRMDKFLMLVRRYLRGSLRCLARCQWSLDSCEKYAKMLMANDGLFAVSPPYYARNATSMLMHIIDCFLEELAKVSQGAIPAESVAVLMSPFTTYTCLGSVLTLCVASRRLLTGLLRQSEPGRAYQERTRAWHKLGCPGSGPDELELVSNDEEHPEGSEDDEPDNDDDGAGPLDPRAGRVDVALPSLPVPGEALATALRALRGRSSSKAHKRTDICLQRFESLAAGEYPLSERPAPPAPRAATHPRRSARALRDLESLLKADTDELKLRGLSRKHRKRLLRRSRLGHSIVDDVPIPPRTIHKKTQKNGEWLIESTKTSPEKDSSNKENNNKKNKKPKDKTRKRKLETQNGDVLQNGDFSKKLKTDSKDKIKLAKKDKVKDNGSPKKIKTKEDNKEIKHDLKVPKTDNKIKEKDTNKSQMDVTKKTESSKTDKINKTDAQKKPKDKAEPTLLINKLKTHSKQIQKDKKTYDTKKFEKDMKKVFDSPKKVKFVLKNNSMQKPVDYYQSVRRSPNIPFDSSRKPSKTNLKPSIPSPINPFFKKKLRMK